MRDDQTTALSSRLSSLERRLRRGRAVTLLAVVALATMAFTPGWRDEVRAESFVLVDGDGNARGRWSVSEDGSPSLALLTDGVDKPRVELYLNGEEAFFVMRDLKSRNRIGLSVDRMGNPHAVLLDERQLPRLHAAVGDGGKPNIVLLDEKGEMPVGMGVMRDGTPWARPGHDEAWPAKKR